LFLSEGEFLFEDTNMEDWGVGLILLFISLFMLCGCLVGLVKILNSMMKGTVQMLDPNVNQRNSST
jgi:sodium-dependent phosphate cotransporter